MVAFRAEVRSTDEALQAGGEGHQGIILSRSDQNSGTLEWGDPTGVARPARKRVKGGKRQGGGGRSCGTCMVLRPSMAALVKTRMAVVATGAKSSGRESALALATVPSGLARSTIPVIRDVIPNSRSSFGNKKGLRESAESDSNRSWTKSPHRGTKKGVATGCLEEGGGIVAWRGANRDSEGGEREGQRGGRECCRRGRGANKGEGARDVGPEEERWQLRVEGRMREKEGEERGGNGGRS